MSGIVKTIKNNPVRIYTIVVAALAIVNYYVHVPVELVIPFFAAVFGIGGEIVQAKTTPSRLVLKSIDPKTDEPVGP